MPVRRLLAAVVAALAYSAQPAAAQQTWYDAYPDAGLAPDFGGVLGSWSGDSGIVVGANIGQRGWYVGDRVYAYFDVDNNWATGDGGADYMLAYERYATSESVYIGRWVGAGYDYSSPATTALVQAGTGAITLGALGSELGFPRDQLRFWLFSVYKGGGFSPTDRAPDSGAYVLFQSQVGGASGGPAEAPPTQPAPDATSTQPSSGAPSTGETPSGAPAAPDLVRWPTLRGAGRVGSRLRVDPGRWSGASRFRYRWLRDARPMRGATGRTYRVRRADRGHRIACRVTALGPGGSSNAASNGRRIR
jgi:hypothetical protein